MLDTALLFVSMSSISFVFLLCTVFVLGAGSMVALAVTASNNHQQPLPSNVFIKFQNLVADVAPWWSAQVSCPIRYKCQSFLVEQTLCLRDIPDFKPVEVELLEFVQHRRQTTSRHFF